MILLVTGGAGFIGSHVVRALIARSDTVRVLDDLSSGSRQNLEGLDLNFVEGDIVDERVVRQAMAGVTHVIHLAALVSVPRSVAEPMLSNAINVGGTLNVLVAARELGIRRVVLASSSAVYGDAGEAVNHEDLPLRPTSPYGADKAAAEMYGTAFHKAFGLETVSLRYFNVFGPRQDPSSGYAAAIPRFVSALLAARSPVIFGDGEQTRDFTYVENVVRATLLALQAPRAAGLSLNVASGVSVDVNTLASEIAAAVGRPDVRAVHAEPRASDIRYSSASIQRTREILGFTPAVGLRDGLEQTVRWYRERPAD